MMNITLYTKQGCGLCDDVKSELDGLAVRYPHRLHEVDISRVPELWERYRLVIPVVRIGEMELQAPISSQALISALDQASPSVATRSGNML